MLIALKQEYNDYFEVFSKGIVTGSEENIVTLGQKEIENILPQKKPYLFVDEVLNYQKEEEYIQAVCNLKKRINFYKDFNPNKLIFPSFLVLEAMCQAVALLWYLVRDNQGSHRILMIFKMEFFGKIEGYDPLEIRCKIKTKEPIGFGFTQAIYKNKIAAVAVLKGVNILGADHAFNSWYQS
ncbi:MAG: hypothetical protein BGO10_00970 [Chlamydia sp. 32-24]|nr:MAG: hypothetical protein BGO10_00970 [Chlamydia sp. 32-24]